MFSFRKRSNAFCHVKVPSHKNSPCSSPRVQSMPPDYYRPSDIQSQRTTNTAFFGLDIPEESSPLTKSLEHNLSSIDPNFYADDDEPLLGRSSCHTLVASLNKTSCKESFVEEMLKRNHQHQLNFHSSPIYANNCVTAIESEEQKDDTKFKRLASMLLVHNLFILASILTF